MYELHCTVAGLTSVALPCFTSFGFPCLSWSLIFSGIFNLPLPVSLSLSQFVSTVLFPELFASIQQSLLHYRSNTFLTRSLSGAVKLHTLSVSLLPHNFVCTHTDERQSQRETQPEPSKKEGEGEVEH